MQCGIVITHARTARIGLPLSLIQAIDSLPAAAGVAVVEVSWFKQPTNEVCPPWHPFLPPFQRLFCRRYAPLLRSSSLGLQLGAAKVSSLPPLPHLPTPPTAPPNSTTSRANLCSALPGPPCVSLARDVLECWGLNASQRVKRAFTVDFIVLTTAVAGVCARDCGSFADSARCGRARWPAGLGGTARRASRSSRHTSPGLSGHQCQCFFFGISACLSSRCVTTHPCSIVCDE
jgi:hypothetical protein